MLLLAALLSAPCNAHPTYAVQPKVSSTRLVRRSGAYLASAQLRFTLREVEPAVIPSVDPGLLDHVHGHLVVARRVVQSSGGTVEANGSSAAQARTRLNQTIARMQRDLQSELDREERAYDNVTANGASQSQGPAYGFPGGPDAHTPCVH
ncbi:MAG TPA: hypothetical protein VKT72_15235 [Candidatus Baltobacteraceae bacterium]|nr:hypothetical protein [Candidatus Baltobacteraceae bacterium]